MSKLLEAGCKLPRSISACSSMSKWRELTTIRKWQLLNQLLFPISITYEINTQNHGRRKDSRVLVCSAGWYCLLFCVIELRARRKWGLSGLKKTFYYSKIAHKHKATGGWPKRWLLEKRQPYIGLLGRLVLCVWFDDLIILIGLWRVMNTLQRQRLKHTTHKHRRYSIKDLLENGLVRKYNQNQVRNTRWCCRCTNLVWKHRQVKACKAKDKKK